MLINPVQKLVKEVIRGDYIRSGPTFGKVTNIIVQNPTRIDIHIDIAVIRSSQKLSLDPNDDIIVYEYRKSS